MSGSFRGGPGLGCMLPHCNKVRVLECNVRRGYGCGFFSWL